MAASFVVLFIIVYYFYTFLRQPVPSFSFDSENGVVVNVKTPCADEDCLRQGDQLISIGDIAIIDFLSDRTISIYKPLKDRDSVPVVFRRGSETREVEVEVQAQWRGGEAGFLGILASLTALLFPLLFWVMGTVTIVFLRPRDSRWLLLVLFQYDTALWASSGFLAFSQEAYSSVLFRVVIWLFLPLSVHLHLILPSAPFKKYHRAILGPLYASAVLLIILDWMHLVPRNVRLSVTLLALGASLALLFLRLWVPAPQATRIANRMMLYGVGLGLGPIIVLVALYLIDLSSALTSNFSSIVVGVFMVVSPLWPLTYIYAIYKHDMGTFEFRSNRLLGTYGFFAIFVTLYLAIYNLSIDAWSRLGLDPALLGLSISLAFALAGQVLYGKFQRWIDRRVFSIKYTPHEVISAFAAKIPAAFNREILRGVITDEILPTLLIRQSALYESIDDEIVVVYEQNVPDGSEPGGRDEVMGLAKVAGEYVSFSTDMTQRYGWVRLVVTLEIREEIIGVWLLGRRDPDDYYPRSDIVLLTNLANQIAPVIGNVRLVEQARQEVEENRRLQQQLIHSQKMEAIGRLSAGVAHDFNNILSVIIGYSNLVLGQYQEDPELRLSVSNIKEAGERAAALTKQLLAFSRKQVLETRVTNLNRVVSDVEKMLRRLAGEDIELVTRLADPLPNVEVDPGQMGQVIINLAVNARDAMPDGGRITITTEELHCSTPGLDSHEGVAPGFYALLTVADTGTGVSEEVKARIFEPYYTTKELGKGTGLGLSMVYGIVDQSQGFIFLDSNSGSGAKFSIYLPAVEHEEIEPEAEDAVLGLGSGTQATETILLVEDEDSVRRVAREILERRGYEILEAHSGSRALELFRGAEGGVDLLLTDVVMPHMKGPELARQLLELDPDLVVVYMSGYNEESFLGRRIGEEGSNLIHKPFSPRHLCERIQAALERRGLASSDHEGTPQGPSRESAHMG